MLDEKQKINQIISLSQEVARVNDLDSYDFLPIV